MTKLKRGDLVVIDGTGWWNNRDMSDLVWSYRATYGVNPMLVLGEGRPVQAKFPAPDKGIPDDDKIEFGIRAPEFIRREFATLKCLCGDQIVHIPKEFLKEF